MSAKSINKIRIAIDADSLVYKSCYRHQTSDGCGVHIERAYIELGYEIGKIKSAVFRLLKYQPGDKVYPLLVLSPKHSFRNDLLESYKANRPQTQNIHGIKQLKHMIMHRLDYAVVHKNIEADDIVIWYAYMKDYLVAAIDKDVINACPTACYNYNTRGWSQPHSEYEIERWYVKQALMGDSTDNIKGAENIGEDRAEKWVNKFVGEPYSWGQFVDLFGDEHLALLAMNLVRMDRIHWIDGKFIHNPWSPFDSPYWEF